MKPIILYSVLLLLSCSVNSAKKIESINNPLLVSILVNSKLANLNILQKNIEKNLLVKIYEVPSTEEDKCFPESHGICKHKYYLATSQLDDSPIINAYYLGEFGEIVEYKWEKTNELDTAIIYIRTNKYSQVALDYNKSLVNIEKKYKIVAKPNKVILK